MGDGPVINTAVVKARMKELGITPQYIASKLLKSTTYARNVINGHVPSREGRQVLRVMGAVLKMPMKTLVIGDLPRKTA